MSWQEVGDFEKKQHIVAFVKIILPREHSNK